ncbi:MAG: tetratricopeptide repeat protein [Abitibacteriaceae bacterium]|nr:tetratricopeptide repeat protein [Abditibacteriaceae bacterium]
MDNQQSSLAHQQEPIVEEQGPLERSQQHEAKGDALGDDGQFSSALGEYKKAVRFDPASPQRLTKLAEGYAAADLPLKALEAYQRAIQAQREQGGAELVDAHIGLGDLCRTFAHSAAAVRSYERAVRSRPRHPFYRWKLAVALAALGLYDQAEKQLLTALELSPGDSFYHFQLADVYLIMRRDDEAIAQLQRAVDLAPRDDYYRLRLGAALLRMERVAEAIPNFERVVEMQPQNSSYRTILRYAYTRNHEEPAIAVDVDMVELGAYDEDFVRRIVLLSQPIGAA